MIDRQARSIGVTLLLAGTLACGEVVTTRASSTADARGQLEPGGWWPSAIPEPATAIVEMHDLDTNEQKIVFSLAPDACLEAAARMEAPAIITLTPVPTLPLEGWPEWLTSSLALDAARDRGAVAAPVAGGALLLTCEEGKGYFWR